jgi:predicted DNA-binding transcriptional regulator YafY
VPRAITLMSAQDRQTAIEHLLRQSGELRLTDLASRFQVSEMTIRRDLGTLEDRGVLRRVVGGGAIAQKAREPSFITRALDESSGKAHIGVAVANLLEAGEALELADEPRSRTPHDRRHDQLEKPVCQSGASPVSTPFYLDVTLRKPTGGMTAEMRSAGVSC